MSNNYEVTGRDKDGNVVFHLLLEAVSADVAKLYAAAHLQRTPDGADGVRNAVRTEAVRRKLIAVREEL